MNIKEYNSLQINIIKRYQLESLMNTDIKEFKNICELIALFRKYEKEPIIIDAIDILVNAELNHYYNVKGDILDFS